jgi:ABC-type multidrug transport system fused ATPase/permease subunit
MSGLRGPMAVFRSESVAGRKGKEHAEKKSKGERLRDLLPDIWALVRPRRALLGLGLVLVGINRVSGLVLPASTKYLIDDIVVKGRRELLLPLIGAVVLATAVQGVTSYALTQVLSKAAQRLIAEMRCRVQEHVGRLPVAYFDSTKMGNLVWRIMADVEGLRNLIGTGLVELAGGLLTAAISLVVLFRISSTMTLLAFSFLLVTGIALQFALGTIRPIFVERAKIYSEVTGRLTESLGGIRVVKGYHAEAREAKVFAGGVGRLLANVLKTLTATSVMGLSSTLLLGVVGATVMFVGTRQILAGTLTLGGFFTYTMFLGFLVAPLFQIVSIGTQLTEAAAGLERTRELLRERPEDEDPRRTVALGPLEGRVAFEEVRFSYAEGKEVLRGVSFEVSPGTVTALVGPSGAGKSTIISLVAAFAVPTSGRILVDGVDLSTVRLDSYRTALGVVLQESFLFDGTIRENVAFSKPGATEDEILGACRIARVDEFAERFEQGYETVVGERGVKLSGGQRQRVSIARALLADPRILILDEATSSLDSESEALIQQGLAVLMKGRTTFVIAHRLSTIRRADRILVVEDGLVVESGTHDELYERKGRYFEMYTKQHGLERNLFIAPGEGEESAFGREGGEEEREPSPDLRSALNLLRSGRSAAP